MTLFLRLLTLCVLLVGTHALRLSRQPLGESATEAAQVECKAGVVESIAKKKHNTIKWCHGGVRSITSNLTVDEFLAKAVDSVANTNLTRMWGSDGRHVKNATVQYPLSIAAIEASIKPEGHIGSWQRVVEKLSLAVGEGRQIEVAVLGGSMTKGGVRGLGGGKFVNKKGKHMEPPWVDRFRRVMSPLGGANVMNLALGGTTSAYALQNIARMEQNLSRADIVIVDYAVNDFNDQGKLCCGMTKICDNWKPCNSVPHPLIYALNNKTGMKSHHLENLVRLLLNFPNKPAVVFLETFQHDLGYSCDLELRDYVHWPVIQQFDLPVVSYKHAVCHTGRTHWTVFDPVQDASTPHPGKSTHELVAHLLGAAFYHQLGRLCEPGEVNLHDHVGVQNLDQQTFECLVHRTADYYPGHAKGWHSAAQGWTLYEDVAGKPGWIAKADGQKYTITFPFTSKQGAVTIGYLSSFEDVGSVRCWLGGSEVVDERSSSCEINALWQDQSSQTSFLTMIMATDPDSRKHYELTCESDGSKFKIVSVSAC